MKIGFDAFLLTGYFSGVEICISRLLERLATIPFAHSLEIFMRSDHDLPRMPKNFAIHHFNVSDKLSRVFYQHFRVGRKARDLGCDFLHCPGYVKGVSGSIPYILTVHDIIALQFPRLCTFFNRKHYSFFLPRSVKKASQVIVPSQCVKKDVLERFGLNDDRIHVVRPGVEEAFKPEPGDSEAVKAARRKYNLPAEYFLFVGNIEPKKNLPFLLHAYRILKNRRKDVPKLVVCGHPAWGYREFREKVVRLKLSNSVHETGYVRRSDLPMVYGGATCFVFPSVYEGYGMPPLEALACGIPVITSGAGALQESTGGIAVYVSLTDPGELADAMENVLDDSELRDAYREKGPEWAGDNNWSRYACETVEVYERMAL